MTRDQLTAIQNVVLAHFGVSNRNSLANHRQCDIERKEVTAAARDSYLAIYASLTPQEVGRALDRLSGMAG